MLFFIISIIIFLVLSIFTLFIAPHINEKIQLIMVYPSVISGILVLISLFIIPLIQSLL